MNAPLPTDCRTLNLIAFINRHDNQAYLCRDGTIVANVQDTDSNGVAHISWEVIEPTISAVRNWLGY